MAEGTGTKLRRRLSPTGRARHKICIYRRDKTNNPMGGRSVEEVCIARIWAETIDMSAKEPFRADSVKHEVTHRFYIRNNIDLGTPDNEHVVDFRGDRLRLLGIRAVNDRSHKWRMDCRQVDGSDKFKDVGQIFNKFGDPVFNTDGDPIFNTG